MALTCLIRWIQNFYPRSPCGERPGNQRTAQSGCYFYPRSPCGERLEGGRFFILKIFISIHALLAESDDFQVHRAALVIIFLSTLSLRRATYQYADDVTDSANFYPRSPCGERLVTMDGKTHDIDFYPRSPCGERRAEQSGNKVDHNFYPRSPCGERHRPF